MRPLQFMSERCQHFSERVALGVRMNAVRNIAAQYSTS